MESEILYWKNNFALRNQLKWVFVEQSNVWRAGLSCSIFFVLNIGVPLASHFLFSCNERPYHSILQLSLSLFAALSFISLSSFARKYGFRRFLFLDRLSDESDKVRQGYAHHLNRSMKLLAGFVLPCFLADTVYNVWWFGSVGTQIPLLYNIYLTKIVACVLLMFSWLYRTSICFLVCLIFRLTCYLQILRLEDYARVFERESDVASILIQHLSIRRHLRIISHRFRFFILSTLVLVTFSQLISLLLVMKPSSKVDISTAGELALCSITLVTGLFICLRSAAKITHKAQAVTSLAAKWHACSTITQMSDETQTAEIAPVQAGYPITSDWDTDSEDDEVDNTRVGRNYTNTISYQKRQALATYFEHNKAGITVYGFMLDRTRLHAIFAIQFSLTLWILKKTIGIS